MRGLDRTESETGNQSFLLAGSCLAEDGGAEEGDDIDPAHLLRDHDHERRQRRTAHARDSEELDEAAEIVALSHDVGFDFELGVDVVQIASCLDVVESEALQGFESFEVLVLLDVPSRRF